MLEWFLELSLKQSKHVQKISLKIESQKLIPFRYTVLIKTGRVSVHTKIHTDSHRHTQKHTQTDTQKQIAKSPTVNRNINPNVHKHGALKRIHSILSKDRENILITALSMELNTSTSFI